MADATEVRLGSLCSGGVGAAVQLALEVGRDDLLNVQEHVALKQTLASCVSLDGMTLDVRPDVVDRVEEGSGRESRSTSGCVDNVVVWMYEQALMNRY